MSAVSTVVSFLLYWVSHLCSRSLSGCVECNTTDIRLWIICSSQAYDTSKLLILAATPGREDSSLSTMEIAAAGAMSAIPTTLVAAPVERAKVLLQVQGQGGNSTQYRGVIDVLRHLYKEGGVKSVFRGSVATAIRDGPGSAAFVVLLLPI